MLFFKENGNTARLISILILFQSINTAILPIVAIPTEDVSFHAKNNIIRIGAVSGETRYNVSVFKLEKNTTYTIIFHNPDPTPHNLVIATDGRIIRNALDAVELEGDIVLGPSFNDDNPEAPGTWMTNWTTPNEDQYITFYCSIIGHFEKGMHGYFQIGSPPGEPPVFGKNVPSFTMLEISVLGIAFMMKTRFSRKKRSVND